MPGLNTSLSIAVQALQAEQGALSVTTNNIANVNTPGYSRQVAVLNESPNLPGKRRNLRRRSYSGAISERSRSNCCN